MLSNHASDLLSTALEEETRSSENIPVNQNWKERMKNVHKAWDRNRPIFWDSRLERECPDFNVCASCFNQLHHYVIYCTNCLRDLCALCDSKVHEHSPFHSRTLYKEEDLSATKLLPRHVFIHTTQMIESRGNSDTIFSAHFS